MPFWRRGTPLHKRLAENAGLGVPKEPPRGIGRFFDPLFWEQNSGEVATARPRQWDAVVTVEADVRGDALHFVALDDGTLVVDEDVPDESLTPLADAVETQVAPPYRAEAMRRGERLWAVGATSIRTVHVREQIDGDTVELAVQGGERTLLVDGARTFGSIPSLEAVGPGMSAYVVRADRIVGDIWEVRVAAL